MAVQHYSGSCQCGAIAFEVDADLDQINACNCSRCRRLGWVLTFVPESAVKIIKDGPTTEYLFNSENISHRFCPTCGIEPYAKGEQGDNMIYAINVNCLDGVDSRALSPNLVDGASK
ncbi:GFA family protein [Paracoccus sp. SCSIO 75233]|uniref:GFA family protein n=1 Tax=Paracoccus sp. SCSIO 75233 TaxID=3017782 RepID=UPI0022EFE6CD|nr:GFA family protein [Paracoccus sp. SCSIO 75233]WBU54053.1 GFA family protein [Paracoccus sp. SCSIO 75233]